MEKLTFIDLFAGAGGLSEGFIQAGFEPVAHVEMDSESCNTIKTRLSYHYLSEKNKKNKYYSYLKGDITRDSLWNLIPDRVLCSVINKEISDVSINEIFGIIDKQICNRNVDVIIGGPPCQAYSLVGRSRDPKRMVGDKRNFLFQYYAEFLNKYKPEYFIFENVLGLLSAGNKIYLNEMIKLFMSKGYVVAEPTIINAEEYGVLQKRRRVIIIGRRGKRTFQFPTIDKCENKWQILKDLFNDLPSMKSGYGFEITNYSETANNYLKEKKIRDKIDFVTQHITRPHNERDLEIYSIVIKNWLEENKRLKYSDLPVRLRTHKNIKSFLDRFKVIDPFGLSHTMVAHIAKDGHYYIHPDLNQLRSISVREAARIQSFPDNYFFEGGRTCAFRQIGNAVPPLMAQAIANKIKSAIYEK